MEDAEIGTADASADNLKQRFAGTNCWYRTFF
jgi:hypothetical protein